METYKGEPLLEFQVIIDGDGEFYYNDLDLDYMARNGFKEGMFLVTPSTLFKTYFDFKYLKNFKIIGL